MTELFIFQEEAEEFAEKVNSSLRKAAEQWIEACIILAEAKDKLSAEGFKRLPELTGLSMSTLYKMVKVGNSDRILGYRKQLGKVGGWSTLHRISTLDDDRFLILKEQYLNGPEPVLIERKDIDRLGKVLIEKKSGTRATEKKQNLKSFASVKIDFDRFEECSNQQEELEAIVEALNVLAQNKIVSIDQGAIEKACDKLYGTLDKQNEQEWNAEYKRIYQHAMKLLRQAYKDEKSKLPYGQKNEKGFMKRWGVSREEVFGYDSPNVGLVMLGREPYKPEILGNGEIPKPV